jgi:hypothetical protein
VIGDVCFALDNRAIWRFSTPNVYLPFNVLGILTDKHFEFHVLVPSLLLIGIPVPAADRAPPSHLNCKLLHPTQGQEPEKFRWMNHQFTGFDVFSWP